MLVHGWSGRGAQLGEFVEPLVAAGYRVVAFDAPAHGRSDGRDTAMPEISEAILRLASEFGPVHAVIAHSFGVACVLFTLQQQGFARRVVAFSPPASLEGLMERFSRTLALSPRTVQILRHMLVRRFGEDVWTRFSALNMARSAGLPALVIHDRDDRDVPWREGEAVSRAWPHARFLRTEGLGHRRILRDPEVIDRVVRFLVQEGHGKCSN
jgi:pimeloyl-ACP methyl ester carboxylesterase